MAPGKWDIFQELQTRDLERQHCTRVEEPCDPASPIVPNPESHHKTGPRSPFGTNRVSYILSRCPNVGAVTPFGHPVEHMVLGFGRFEGAEKGEKEQFSRLPRGTGTLHKASRSWKCCRKACTVNTSGMGKAFRRFRNSF
ncbi:hypothetical protein TNCT_589081 [Trichonephila clavata]|uniref:Uncharacterized protein n=1 Tax=Trichonephila clavata TaxID=2740835 RepID=A0A8X6LX66_TRICU|nr:hypothetical protein TNCT_589081 [Trichonephila clavata]